MWDRRRDGVRAGGILASAFVVALIISGSSGVALHISVGILVTLYVFRIPIRRLDRA